MHTRSRVLSRVVLVGVSLLGTLGSVGCTNDTTGPAPLLPAQLYFQLTLNHHAITMALSAPYDTLRLAATARVATGTPVSDTSTSTTYTVLNGDTNVTVSPTGLLRAVAPDFQAQVVASRTIGNVTHTDTAIVNVNDTTVVPVFSTLAFMAQPGDSARFSANGGPYGTPAYLYVSALDPQGDSIPNVIVQMTSPGPFGKNLTSWSQRTNGLFNLLTFGLPPGRVPVVAEATVYGVSRTDTLIYLVGWPLESEVEVVSVTPTGHHTPLGYFGPHDDTVAVGAIVGWISRLQGQSIDVVFDNSAAVQGIDSTTLSLDGVFSNGFDLQHEGSGGDIAAFTPVSVQNVDTTFNGDGTVLLIDTTFTITNNLRARRFPTAGTYQYHSTMYGTTGVIHVLPEFQVP